MGQFLVGLFAGIVVGLVMEWVIDWTGFLPKRSMSKGKTQKPVQNLVAAPAIKSVNEPISTGVSTSSSSNPETSVE